MISIEIDYINWDVVDVHVGEEVGYQRYLRFATKDISSIG